MARDPVCGMDVDEKTAKHKSEYEGQAYPWRPVHPEDEQDVAKLVRTAMTYLQRDLRRHG